MLSTGLSLLSYNDDNSCAILRAVTTYQKNQWGVSDGSYLDVNTPYTLAAYVRSQKSAVTNAFPRAKYVPDGTSVGPGSSFTNGLPDQPVVTNSSIKATLIANYATCAANVWVQNAAAYAEGLVVQQNSQNAGRADVLDDPIIVTGLAMLGVKVAFSLTAPAAS
jgi:phage tail sheath gpL-like